MDPHMTLCCCLQHWINLFNLFPPNSLWGLWNTPYTCKATLGEGQIQKSWLETRLDDLPFSVYKLRNFTGFLHRKENSSSILQTSHKSIHKSFNILPACETKTWHQVQGILERKLCAMEVEVPQTLKLAGPPHQSMVPDQFLFLVLVTPINSSSSFWDSGLTEGVSPVRWHNVLLVCITKPRKYNGETGCK